MRSVLEHGRKACLCGRALSRRRVYERLRWQPLLYAPLSAMPSCRLMNSSLPFLYRQEDHLINRFSTQQDSPEGPSPINYSSLLDEGDFHKLADDLLHYLQEKFDELGEEHDIDGFDIDYAEGVLTIRLGTSGTYVINKQTPNRQIWLSSPVRGRSLGTLGRRSGDVTGSRWTDIPAGLQGLTGMQRSTNGSISGQRLRFLVFWKRKCMIFWVHV